MGDKPDRDVSITTVMVSVGAILASIENFQQDFLGFILTWANNFSQSLQNQSFAEKLKKVTAFEINLYFACIGFLFSVLYNVFGSENFQQLMDLIYQDE